MAILLECLYRDAGNFKNWGEAYFKNEQGLSLDEIEARIQEGLIDGMYFSAEKVGLPTLYFEERSEQLDHEWHEYDRVREASEDSDGADLADIVDFLKKLKM